MLGNTNISTTVVGDELGINTHSVGQLCTSPNINKWSKYKPVSYNTSVGITEEQRKHAHHGIDLGYAHSLDPIVLFERAKEDWRYVRPSGGSTSPYRLGDFRKYNHNAICPFRYSFPSTIYTYSNSGGSAAFAIYQDATADLKVTDFNYYMEGTGGYSNYRYAIAWKKSGSTIQDDVHFVYGKYVSEGTLDNVIEVTFPSAGTYEIMAIITTEIDQNYNALDSIVLPNSYGTVTVERKYEFVNVSIDNANSLALEITSDKQIMGFNYINLSAWLSEQEIGGTQGSGRLDLWMDVLNANGTIIRQFQYRPVGGGDFSYSGSDKKTYILDYNVGGLIDLSNYMSAEDFDQMKRVIIKPIVETISGNAIFVTDKKYEWDIRYHY